VWLTAQDIKNNNNSSLISNTEIGTFKTAPNSNVSSSPISFLWSGDLGGQKYCRIAHTGGYYVFKSMQSLNADFFLANGDMIYMLMIHVLNKDLFLIIRSITKILPGKTFREILNP
jgi:phosphodiesterase/alkaline phosphatase D-like protein